MCFSDKCSDFLSKPEVGMCHVVMLTSAAWKHPAGFIKCLTSFITNVELKGLTEQEETEKLSSTEERIIVTAVSLINKKYSSLTNIDHYLCSFANYISSPAQHWDPFTMFLL